MKSFSANVKWILLPTFLLLSLVAASPVCAELPKNISIQGLSGEALANVSEALRTTSGLFSGEKVNPLWLNRYLRLAPERIAQALEPFGYYSSLVEINTDRTSSPPTIQIIIDPGEPVHISTRHLDIVGTRHDALLKQLDLFPLELGSILMHLRYEQAKAELQAFAVDLGFLDARFTRHQILVDRENNSAHLELVLDTGPQFLFGEISIVGGEDYPQRFLRRYLSARRGEIFSHADLGKTQQQFLDSDRFSTAVAIQLREEQQENNQIPVEIRLQAKARKRLRPGIGYGTDTGARAFLRYQDVNLWHLGHNFTTDLLVAERQQNLIGSYLMPSYRNIDTMLALRGGYYAENLDVYDTSYLFAEAEQIYGFNKGRVGSFYVRLQTESSTISGEEITTGTLMPGLRFRMGKLDEPLRPKRGYHLSLEVRGTREELFSEISLLQALGNVNWIYPLPWRTYLRVRGNAATTMQKNDFDEMPASLRFFTGGDRSVRGYAYQSLGPTNAVGEVVGGKHLLVGSIEFEKRFLKNWGTAIFYDAGNSFDILADYELAEAAGLGLRYFTPIGPVRVDLARTINADRNRYRLHIGLGVGW